MASKLAHGNCKIGLQADVQHNSASGDCTWKRFAPSQCNLRVQLTVHEVEDTHVLQTTNWHTSSNLKQELNMACC